MNSIIALQDLIKEEEDRVNLCRKQLAEHESGEVKLSRMIKASTELKLEEAETALEKHKNMLAELQEQDLEELEKEEKLREAIKRKNYFRFQRTRIKRNKTKKNDAVVEAMLILDELPPEIEFEDDKIFDIVEKTLNLQLAIHDELYVKQKEISTEFEKLIKEHCKREEDIVELGLLNVQIPIVVLQFYVLIGNIKQNIQDDNLPQFKGLPNFEDWWIDELWRSHQAYFGLYKWKSIISDMCITTDQKLAWEVIFSNWIFIKEIINKKGALGFAYNFAFDTLILKYCELEEELIDTNIMRLDSIIQNLTAKEDFTQVSKDHKIATPYLEFKKRKYLNLLKRPDSVKEQTKNRRITDSIDEA
jgi:hypothetical protein